MPPSAIGTAPKSREIELDFIRGVAILMVLDFHANHTVLLAPFVALGIANFGWAGVDVFFVLSGFLVGGLLVKEWKLRGRIDSKRFLIRRGFKIWPQYYCYLLLILATGHRSFRMLLGNLLNVQNYVGGIAHTWTLAVEEHAYLLLVLILAIVARRKMKARDLFIVLAVLCGLVTLNCLVLAAFGIDPYSRTDTRVNGIFLGVLLALLYHWSPERFQKLQSLSWAWVLTIVSTLVYLRFEPKIWWGPPIRWMLADLSGAATLLLLYRRSSAEQRPWLYRAIAFIGLYSYGIYLWHVSVVDPVLKLTRFFPAKLAFAWEVIGPPVAGVLLGIATTKLVEFPALALRDRLFPRRVDSAAGIPAEIEAQTGSEGNSESVSSEAV